MNDRDALLTGILLDPAEDTLRLVLADALRESDDPTSQAQGRFLWGGVTAAQFRDHDSIEDPLYYTALQEMAEVTVEGHSARWLSELGIGSQPITAQDWSWDSAHDRVAVRIGQALGTFTRGMLAELAVNLNDWYAFAPISFRKWPLELGTIIDAPGLRFELGPYGSAWKLTARLVVPARRVLMGGGLIPAAVAPHAMLREESGNWHVEERFSTRASLLAGLARTSADLVEALKETAGDRWPTPRRRRRR